MANNEKKVTISYKIKDNVSKGVGKIRGGISKLAKSLVSLKGLFIAALGGIAIKKVLTNSISAWARQENAVKSLNTALKNSGQYSAQTSRALQNQASALQRLTTFGDEAIIEAQAIFTQFGLNLQQTKLLTSATLDLAQAKGMDLKSAADLVSKSVGSSTNALSRYGIAIEGIAGSDERVKQAVENIDKIFGGQSQAAADTMAGKLKQLKNVWGDVFLELTGKALSPIISDLSVRTKEWFDNLTEKQKNEYVKRIRGIAEAFIWVAEQSIKAGKAIYSFYKKATNINTFAIQKPEKSPFPEVSLEDYSDETEKMKEFSRKASEEYKKIAEANQEYLNGEQQKEEEEQDRIDKTNLTIFNKKKKLKEDTEKLDKDEEKEKNKIQKKTVSDFLDNMDITSKAVGDFFYKSKEASIATTIINAWMAAARAFADHSFPKSLLVSAAAFASAYKSVSQIQAQNFATGGIVSGNSESGDQIPINVNAGEMVLNREQQTDLFNSIKNPSSQNEESSSMAVMILTDDGEELTTAIFKKQSELKQRGAL